MIIGLGSWVYAEYLSNSYFQSYVNGLSPILVPIVSVGFGVASATVATLLYFTMRNMNQREEPKGEDLSPRRGSTKRTVKRPQASFVRSEKPAAGVLTTLPRSKLSTAGTSNVRHRGAQQSSDEHDQSE